MSDSTKSTASGIATVSEPTVASRHKSGQCSKSCAHKSVWLCSKGGGGVRLADSFALDNICEASTRAKCRQASRQSVLSILRSSGKWVGRGGHLAYVAAAIT